MTKNLSKNGKIWWIQYFYKINSVNWSQNLELEIFIQH